MVYVFILEGSIQPKLQQCAQDNAAAHGTSIPFLTFIDLLGFECGVSSRTILKSWRFRCSEGWLDLLSALEEMEPVKNFYGLLLQVRYANFQPG